MFLTETQKRIGREVMRSGGAEVDRPRPLHRQMPGRGMRPGGGRGAGGLYKIQVGQIYMYEKYLRMAKRLIGPSDSEYKGVRV